MVGLPCTSFAAGTVSLCVNDFLAHFLTAIQLNLHCSAAEVDLLDCLLPYLTTTQLNEQAGEHGHTALHTCADMGAARCARRLLADARVQTRVVDKHGHTPSELAEMAGHIDLAELLRSHDGELQRTE